MQGRDYSLALDFVRHIYGNGRTTHPVEVRNFPNVKGQGAPPKSLFSRSPDEVEEFLAAHDIPGRGTFIGMATREGGKGAREFCKELPWVWVDIDTRKLGLDKLKVVEILKSLPCPPSLIIDSGGGIHAYWLLREAEDISVGVEGWEEKEERILSVLKRLRDVLAGDPAVCELARVMRLPSTHNTKAEVGDAEVVFIEAHWELTFELDALDEWLFEQRILIAPPGADGAVEGEDPYLAALKAIGFKPPIDVEQRLKQMTFQGIGELSIHDTQLRCSASLVRARVDDEQIVTMLMEATRAAAGIYAKSWNWKREEREIRRLIADAHKKGFAPEREQEEVTQKEATNDGPINLGEERQRRERAKQEKAQAQQDEAKAQQGGAKDKAKIEPVARAVIVKWEGERGHGKLMSTGGELWSYRDGVWERIEGKLEAQLCVDISAVTRAAKIEPTSSFLNNVRRAIVDDHNLYKHDVPWDQHKLIVATNGAIDPLTGALHPHDPDHYATQRLGVALLSTAARPNKWLAMLDTALANLDAEERQRVIDTLAEFFGAALLRGKPRDITKALFIVGESRCGKTQLASVLRSLLGGRVCSVRARALGERFGMQPLVGCSGWIADDAVGTNEHLDAEAFKITVTGEHTSIPCKHLPDWEGKLDIPVCLTANHLPGISDQSDALYNRVLVLPMQVVFGERDARDRSREPWQIIVEEELAGVLNWALDGLQRLLARGYYDPPACMLRANAEFKDDNASIGPWLAGAVEYSSHHMVDRRDVVDSYRGWHASEFGFDPKHRPLSPRKLWPLIRRLRPKLNVDGENKDGHCFNKDGERYVVGMKLTARGRAFLAHLLRETDKAGSGRPFDDSVVGVNIPLPKK
jgi:phage/plasmid-associated DNA primase